MGPSFTRHPSIRTHAAPGPRHIVHVSPPCSNSRRQASRYQTTAQGFLFVVGWFWLTNICYQFFAKHRTRTVFRNETAHSEDGYLLCKYSLRIFHFQPAPHYGYIRIQADLGHIEVRLLPLPPSLCFSFPFCLDLGSGKRVTSSELASSSALSSFHFLLFKGTSWRLSGLVRGSSKRSQENCTCL